MNSHRCRGHSACALQKKPRIPLLLSVATFLWAVACYRLSKLIRIDIQAGIIIVTQLEKGVRDSNRIDIGWQAWFDQELNRHLPYLSRFQYLLAETETLEFFQVLSQ